MANEASTNVPYVACRQMVIMRNAIITPWHLFIGVALYFLLSLRNRCEKEGGFDEEDSFSFYACFRNDSLFFY
jgi:hypothetical protein